MCVLWVKVSTGLLIQDKIIAAHANSMLVLVLMAIGTKNEIKTNTMTKRCRPKWRQKPRPKTTRRKPKSRPRSKPRRLRRRPRPRLKRRKIKAKTDTLRTCCRVEYRASKLTTQAPRQCALHRTQSRSTSTDNLANSVRHVASPTLPANVKVKVRSKTFSTRSSANAEGPCELTVSWNRVKCCTNVRRKAFEKACNRWMTFKVIRGHCLCCHLIGHILFAISLPL